MVAREQDTVLLIVMGLSPGIILTTGGEGEVFVHSTVRGGVHHVLQEPQNLWHVVHVPANPCMISIRVVCGISQNLRHIVHKRRLPAAPEVIHPQVISRKPVVVWSEVRIQPPRPGVQRLSAGQHFPRYTSP